MPRVTDFEGNGVHYAATEQEAAACAHEPVAIVGAGNSAGQAAVFLAGRVPKVYLIARGPDLGTTMSRYLVDLVGRDPRIEVLTHSEVCAVDGTRRPESVTVLDKETGLPRELAARAVFVFVGARPATGWLGDTLALDDGATWLPVRLVKDRDQWQAEVTHPRHAKFASLRWSVSGCAIAATTRPGAASLQGSCSPRLAIVFEPPRWAIWGV